MASSTVLKCAEVMAANASADHLQVRCGERPLRDRARAIILVSHVGLPFPAEVEQGKTRLGSGLPP